MNLSTPILRTSSIERVPITPKYVLIEPRQNSPYINYDPRKNVLFIKGNSYDSSVLPLYHDIYENIDSHYLIKDELNVYLYLNKINTLTIKALFDLFKRLRKHQFNQKSVKVTWFCDIANDGMLESAKDFKDLFELNMLIVPV